MGAYPSSASVQMSFVTCYKCGMVFGMPDSVYNKRLHDHAGFFCPAGHEQFFLAKSKEDQLKDQVAQLERDKQNLVKRREWAEQETKKATYDAKVARSHAKAAVTISRKLRQRLKTGTCPCCEKKFADLEAHMKSEHPRYR